MKRRVAVVGATGIAGQQFLVALDLHPWFDVVMLAASERSAGKTYAAAIRDAKTGARRWWCAEEPPAHVLALPVENGDGLNLTGIDIVFSAVESEAARLLEPQYATSSRPHLPHEGILWVLWTGAPWSELPPLYGIACALPMLRRVLK